MKSNKKTLIIISSVVIAGIGGYFLYSYLKKKKQEKESKIESDLEAAKSEGQKIAEEAKANAAVEIAKAKGATELEMADTYIKSLNPKSIKLTFSPEYRIGFWKAKTTGSPTFKAEGKTFDVATGKVYVPIIKDSNAIGRFAYPKKENGLTNIRSSAEKNDGYYNNMLGIVNYPNKIGKIINLTKGKEDGKTWYQVELQVGLVKGKSGGFIPTATKGWVREDSVDIKTA